MNIDIASLEKRFAAYGAMSLALLTVSPSVAVGQVSVNANVTTTSGGGIYFDPATGDFGTTGHSADFELLTDVHGAKTVARLLTEGTQFLATSNNGNMFVASTSAARLAVGSVIGSGLEFANTLGTLASNSFNHFGHWNDTPATGDLGLEIVGSGETTYGWANITVNSDYTITLNAFGSNVAGAPSVAGGQSSATPEPASIVLLAIGAAGIAAYRLRRASSESGSTPSSC